MKPSLPDSHSKKIRILYHHRTLGDGAEGIHIRELVLAFRELGHSVHVIALVGENDSRPHRVDGDFRTKCWSTLGKLLPGVFYEFAEIAYNLVGRRAIQRAIVEFQPDLIYDRYNSFSTAAIRAGKKHGIPVFTEVNAPLVYERSVHEGRTLRLTRLARRYDRIIYDSSDHVFVVSTPLKEFLVAEYALPDSQITVLPNGVDPEKFDPTVGGEEVRQRLGIANKQVVGFVGILRPWHGLDLLLRVFRTLLADIPTAHLLIIGDGPSESSLKEQVRTMGMTNHVSFTGRIAHNEMSKHVAAMDIAVCPNTTFYASPMKIIEYMAMGIATVASDTPNIRDLLTDGEDAKLFARDDEQALATAIKSLLDERSEAKRLGNNARQKVESQLCWSQVAQTIIDQKRMLENSKSIEPKKA